MSQTTETTDQPTPAPQATSEQAQASAESVGVQITALPEQNVAPPENVALSEQVTPITEMSGQVEGQTQTFTLTNAQETQPVETVEQAPAAAVTKKGRISLEELAGLSNYYLPRLSWQHDQLAFYWDKSGRLELYVMDMTTRQIRQVSHGELPRALRAGFIWDRSGQFIVFARDNDGDEQHDLYLIELDSGQVQQLTHDPKIQEYAVQFAPYNQWLTVLTNKEGQLNLWKIRPDGSDYTRLTNYPSPVTGGLWSPDGVWIAYSVNADSLNLKNADGYLMRSDGSEQHQVFHVSEGSSDVVVDWHPSGRKLAVVTDASGVRQPGILDLDTNEVKWLGEAGVEEEPICFSENGQLLACLRHQESQVRPVYYNLESGQRHDLKLPAGVAIVSGFADDDNTLVIYLTAENQRGTVLLYDLKNDTYETLLAPEYGTINPEWLVAGEHIYYPGGGEVQIPALLYRPANIETGQKLPVIIEVHGGPTAQFMRSFQDRVQFLVDQGYVVLQPNVRGSTGYGVKFRDMNLKDWGGGDLEDVAAGVTYLKTLPYVDPERIAIYGGSYGGYMTYMAVTKKPELWKSAVAIIGITDLKRLYDESMEHFKYILREQMGDPEAEAALWADRSAVNFTQNLKAKLLILHGANDPRCPLSQASFFREKLLASGFPEGEQFEYIVFDDQGHGSNDIAHKTRLYNLLADFFARTV